LRSRLLPDERVRHILDTALDFFARRPYADVTTRDIATACKVNVALIYYYFKNKEELFHAVIERAIDQAVQRYKLRTHDTSDPIQLLQSWFEVNLELFTSLKKMAQILVAYSTAVPANPGVQALVRKLYRNEQRILYECIREGTKRGAFRKLDARRAAIFISNHLDGLCFVTMTRPRTNMKRLVMEAWETILEYLKARH
jgi:TetR/AcrR family transcriptional regulator, upper aerobic nicotinate degradation pathway regulator